MKYYFDQLDPVRFQQLINAILIKKYGDNIRLTPLRGSDGGRDGETAPENPFSPFIFEADRSQALDFDEEATWRPGRYMFQVKHHDISASRISDLRNTVVSEFEQELNANVLPRKNDNRVNYFFLITNVPSSEQSISKVDEKRKKLVRSMSYLHADVWWGERVTALLDTMPSIWASFPELFPGHKVPLVSNLVNNVDEEMTKSIRFFLRKQYDKDQYVKFRQVEIEHKLDQLFVDLEVDLDQRSPQTRHLLRYISDEDFIGEFMQFGGEDIPDDLSDRQMRYLTQRRFYRRVKSFDSRSLVKLLLLETNNSEASVSLNRIILEGGPGQGKSTITQMLAQMYRIALLATPTNEKSNLGSIKIVRLPFRIELREFSEFVDQDESRSVEEYLAHLVKTDTGGRNISVNDIQRVVERSPVILIFDGLDEIGNDKTRNRILTKVKDCISRFEDDLNSDLRIIITTRPPALAGHHELLQDFLRLSIAPLSDPKIDEYTQNWIKVQIRDKDEKKRVLTSFQRRLGDKHVRAIATNPMQLSILLHFIRIKGEAFPNNRAQLYKSYFETVIDRDVEKSVGISVDVREIVESLHKYLGYKIHAATEAQRSDGTFSRVQLLDMVRHWLSSRGNSPDLADELFKLGEERLGLIVVTRGEGEEVQYGFEIQPVREYFAAAFINDEIKGDVEPIFQQMVIRPFWREVALFLGGLRRIREKANLILQAKELDSSLESGWLQQGRSVILQLLQEGVFSQPPQAYQLALEFVTEALDPQIIPKQLELEHYVTLLPELINQNTASDNLPQRQVLQMLKANRDTDDEYALQRIYRVACKVNDRQTVNKVFKDYKNDNINLLSKLSIVWPLMYESVQPHEYRLPNIPDEVLSKWWWYTANRNFEITSVALPERLHHLLVQEYALRPVSLMYRHELLAPRSNWAIWHLTYLSYILMSINRAFPPRMSRDVIDDYSALIDLADIDYSGLTDSTSRVVASLLELMTILIGMFGDPQGGIKTLEEKPILKELLSFIQYPSLDGWIAARGCAMIVHTLFDDLHFRHIVLESENSRTRRSTLITTVQQLSEILGERNRRYRTPFAAFGVPSQVYSSDGNVIDIIDLYTLDVRGELDKESSWINRLPLDMYYIQPLTKVFKNELPTLLEWIGRKQDYTSSGDDRKLHVSMQRSILAQASNTNDNLILQGALVSLMTSNFLNLISVDDLLKMLSAAKNMPYAARLFATNNYKEMQLDERYAPILESTAHRILEQPDLYGLRLVTVAAKHLAEYYPRQVSPLIEQEAKLDINVVL